MPRLAISALGTLTFSLDKQSLTGFRSAKIQGLLLYLAVEQTRDHRREQLADLLWPKADPAAANTNFRQSLSRLRRALNDKQAARPFLLVTRETVQINPEADVDLDLNRFLLMAEEGDLEGAAAIYQGELAPGFTCDSAAFEDWLRLEREQLHRLALDSFYRLGERYLSLGRSSGDRQAIVAAQAIARRQLALEPWREEAHRQLMNALILAGDRSAALTQYDVCCDVLADELGVPPAPETLALFEAIRDGELLPRPIGETVHDSAALLHLPRQATPFIGRSAELEQLRQFLRNPSLSEPSPVVTIVGPGGIGKSRLAIEAAIQLVERPPRQEENGTGPFPDGLFFVSLAPLSDPSNIPAAIADAVGYRFYEQADPKAQVIDFLRQKSLLLILDNFEHLLEGGVELVASILEEAPGCQLCVTSRQKLNILEEAVLNIDGLATEIGKVKGADDPPAYDWHNELDSEATQLFLQSARRAFVNFKPQPEESGDIIRICRLVQGMPLAIVLAASWVDTLPVATIASEIQADIDFLESDLRSLPARQRSMRAAFNYSWDLLTEDEQDLFARLSVFRGGFTRQAAQTITGTPLRLLARLVGKSLLLYDPVSDRYQVHELLRQFGAEKLAEEGQAEAVRTEHSRYYLQALARQEAKSRQPYRWDNYATFSADYENCLSGWRWALDQTDLPLLEQSLNGIYRFHDISGRDIEALAIFRQTLDQLPKEGEFSGEMNDRVIHLRARVWNRLYYLDPKRAEDKAEAHLALFRASGDEFEEALALERLTTPVIRKEGMAAGNALNLEAISIYRRLDDPRLAFALSLRAALMLASGQNEEAMQLAGEGLAVANRNTDRFNASGILQLLGFQQLFGSGDHEAAARYFQEARGEGQTLRDEGYSSTPLLNSLVFLGFIDLVKGHVAGAEQLSQQINAIAAERGAPSDISAQMGMACLLNVTAGNYELAMEQASIVVTQTAKTLSIVVLASLSLLLATCGLGHAQRVKVMLERASEHIVVRRQPDAAGLLFAMPAFAWLLAAKGRMERAIEILAFARAHPACPHGWWARLHLLQKLETRLHAEISAREYQTAQDRGRELDLATTVMALSKELLSLTDPHG